MSVPGSIPITAFNRQVSRAERLANLIEQGEFPGAAIHVIAFDHSAYPVLGHKVKGRIFGNFFTVFAVHAAQHFKRFEHRTIRVWRIKMQRLKDRPWEGSYPGTATFEQRTEEIGLIFFKRTALLCERSHAIARDAL